MKFLLLVAGLAFTVPALAAPPTEAQAREMSRMFGLDTVLAVTSRMQVDTGALATLPVAQKSCLVSGIEKEMEGRVLRSIATTFRDGETVEAWRTFASTPGGSKVMEMLRTVTAAVATGQTPPTSKSLEASLTVAERREVDAFGRTPAASVMKSDLSAGMRPTPEEAEAISGRLFISCGIQPAEPRT